MCSNNRHLENLDTWSHITSNLLNIWIQDKNTNVSNHLKLFKFNISNLVFF